MKFAWQGCETGGRAETGEVDASDVMDAIESLRRKGVFVSGIKPADGSHTAGTPRRRLGRARVLKNLAMFTRQLYVLTSSGTALVDALRSLERQSRDLAWREVVGDVRNMVERGQPLSEAMGRHPACFDPICRSLIAAGETGGGMEKMLDRLSVLSRKQLQLRSAMVGAMIYPCLLIAVASAVFTLMLLFVLPRFSEMFQSMDIPLPITTRILMDMSIFLKSWWWAVGIALLAAGWGARYWGKTPVGREFLHANVLRLPIAGPLVRTLQVARIVRVLGVLVAGRVPLLEALGLARQTAGNLRYAQLIASAEAAVTSGSTVSSVLAESDLIEPSLCEAVRSGERSGELATLLLSMADFLDEENEVIIRSLTSVLEPIILIILGVFVGLVAMSMFLPMFDLTNMAQRGGGH